METKVLIALLIVFALVVGVNGMLYLMLRRGQTNQHIRLWQKATKRARNPWEDEDNQLKELSDLVEQLKEPAEED